MDYQDVRQKYPEFSYKEFNYELNGPDLVITFLFQVGTDFWFSPRLVYKNIPVDKFSVTNKEIVDNFVFHLGLAEIPSYWKAFTSPNIKIEAGYLDPEQIEWWKDLYLQGMGQFFYENKIDSTPNNFITITSNSAKKYTYGKSSNVTGTLIPVGGGKDSAVTLELLKDQSNVAAFLINPMLASKQIVDASNVVSSVVVDRQIDPKLVDLNSQGFLNGHTPFSSVVAFLAVFGAYIFGFSEVVLSNERSSNEENTSYLGLKVNHQYSKTFEFETKFRSYINTYVTNINYFSFLRPLYEIQIAKVFSNMKKYLPLFRSCNIGQKTNSWCSNCSKCLSTYILLKPFLSTEELLAIFKEDLIAKPSLKETLSQLIEEDKVKPFECVGTRGELRNALNGNLDMVNLWNDDHNLPDEYARLLKQEIQR